MIDLLLWNVLKLNRMEKKTASAKNCFCFCFLFLVAYKLLLLAVDLISKANSTNGKSMSACGIVAE